MTNYLWYILEANVWIILLFGVFKLTQRYLSFSWQRFSLLSIPLLSILIIWIKQARITESSWSYRIPVIELDSVTIQPHQQEVISSGAFSWVEIGYWSGVILLSAWMFFHLFKVLREFLSAKRLKEDGFSVIELPDKNPSSFFRFIQLPSGLLEEDRQIIFQHEKIHAQKWHSADRLYLEAVHCIFWFNPLLLLIKKELLHLHEFEVDRIMYNRYRAGYMEFLLAYSLGTSSFKYLFTNQFVTKLTLIKRIKIMKNNSKKVLIAAFALPVIAGGLTLISFTVEKDSKEPVQLENRTSLQTPGDDQIRKTEGTIETPKTNKEVSTKSESSEKVIDEKKIQFIPPVETVDYNHVSEKNSKLKQESEVDYKHISEKTSKSKQEIEVDKQPEFVGGMEAMTKYMIKNIHYPDAAVKSKTTGKVMVSFLVTKDGKVTKAAIKQGVSKELDEEALRVISSMPNWTPGEKDGKKVDVEMMLPVSFKL